MDDLTTAMARAADTLSESLAAPRSTGSQTRYGTVVANNGSTLDVAMAGGTIAGVPMTTACCSAVAGDRVLLDVTGPLVTATGILANSDNGPYVKLVSVTLNNPSNGTSVELDVPDGWEFLAWLQPVSIGFVGSAYINPTWRSTAKLWIYANNKGSWLLTAVLVRPGAIA